MGSVNVYSFIGNGALWIVDPLGLSWWNPASREFAVWRAGGAVIRGAGQAIAWTGRQAYAGASWSVNQAYWAVRYGAGFVSGVISTDIFHNLSGHVDFSDSTGCEFLITVSGIATDREGNRVFRRQLNSQARDYQSIPISNTAYVYNPTFSKIPVVGHVGDIVLQSVPQRLLGAIGPTAKAMRDTIERAYRQGIENGCAPECVVIHVVAYRQGAGVYWNASSLLSSEVRKSVRLMTMGGESHPTSDAAGTVRNVAHRWDIVAWQAGISRGEVERFGNDAIGRETSGLGYLTEPFRAHHWMNYIEYINR